MLLLSILLIALLCLAWLIVIAASQLAETASLIDNESDDEGQS